MAAAQVPCRAERAATTCPKATSPGRRRPSELKPQPQASWAAPEGWPALSWPCVRSALLSHLQGSCPWPLLPSALGGGKQAAEHGTPAPLSPTSGPVGQQATPAMPALPEGQAVCHSGQPPTCLLGIHMNAAQRRSPSAFSCPLSTQELR